MSFVFKFALPIALIATLFLSSCEGENLDVSGTDIDLPEPVEVEINPLLTRSSSDSEGLDFGCFEIEYPFLVEFSDGNSIVFNSQDDWESAEQDSSFFMVNFIYPLTATSQNGETIVVNNDEDLVRLFVNCVPDDWESHEDLVFPAYQISQENSCYTLAYPIQLVDEDDEVITVETESAFNAALTNRVYFFVWPLILIDKEGNEISVENDDALADALFSCNDWEWSEGDTLVGLLDFVCYSIVYPITVLVEDEEVRVDSDEILNDLAIRGELQAIIFPLVLIDASGNIFEVGTVEDLSELIYSCIDNFVDNFDIYELLAAASYYSIDSTGTPMDSMACLEVIFPVSINKTKADERIFNSLEELAEILENEEAVCCLDFPVTVLRAQDQEKITIEDSNQLYELIETCQ